jgi:hypothetical protein
MKASFMLEIVVQLSESLGGASVLNVVEHRLLQTQ